MEIVKQGQTFLDKVTQLTGSYENALEMAFLNGISVTDDSSQDQRSTYEKIFVIGKEIKVSSITNKRVVSFFNPKNEPATAIVSVKKNDAVEEIGIGFMIIESNFKIGDNILGLKSYWINKNSSEVHDDSCPYFKRGLINKKYIGSFLTCYEAIKIAKTKYKNADGCNTCSKQCSTK